MTTTTEVRWGQGEQIEGTPFREVVAGAETEGRLVVLAADMPIGLEVPEHVHDDADQICVVLSGRVGGRVGGETLIAEAGGVMVLPRGVPHAHWNAGDEPARVLEIYTPSGFDEVLRAHGASGRPFGD